MPALTLSHEQAAEVLGCSPRHVRNLLDAGELPAVKIGRRRRVSAAGLVEYVRQSELAENGRTYTPAYELPLGVEVES